MIHIQYGELQAALTSGLRALGWERAVEIDGPNRLGGYRVGDDAHRVALSFAPPSRKDDRDAGRHWWVSA